MKIEASNDTCIATQVIIHHHKGGDLDSAFICTSNSVCFGFTYFTENMGNAFMMILFNISRFSSLGQVSLYQETKLNFSDEIWFVKTKGYMTQGLSFFIFWTIFIITLIRKTRKPWVEYLYIVSNQEKVI